MRSSPLSPEQVRAIAIVVREHRGKHSSRDAATNACEVCKFIPEALGGVELLEAEVADVVGRASEQEERGSLRAPP